jgi:hypothetical protein
MSVFDYLKNLPHFVLFKDLTYSLEESEKILYEIKQGKQDFNKKDFQKIVEHYKILFEILLFLHEKTPDLLLITRVNDLLEERICFSNQEFSKVLGLSKNPEGKNLYDFFSVNDVKVLKNFLNKEIKKIKEKDVLNKVISKISPEIKIHIKDKQKDCLKIYNFHLQLTGSLSFQGDKKFFMGYTALIGREVTNEEINNSIVQDFTNIPTVLLKEFKDEIYSRKFLNKEDTKIKLNNYYILTGLSDITGSTKLRSDAILKDKKEKGVKNLIAYQNYLQQINNFLKKNWLEEKEFLERLGVQIFNLEESDGIFYQFLVPDNFSLESLRKKELEILIKIQKLSKENNYPLKHLIIAHKNKEDFYFEENFKKNFVPELSSIEVFIKKNRLEKAVDKKTQERIMQNNSLTVVVDNQEDLENYKKMFSLFFKNNFLEGEVENIIGLKPMIYLRTI